MFAGMLHLLAMLNSFYGIVNGDNSNVLHSDCRHFFVLGYIFLFQFLFHFAESLCKFFHFGIALHFSFLNDLSCDNCPRNMIYKNINKTIIGMCVDGFILSLCLPIYRRFRSSYCFLFATER